jgi:CRISPR-associated protein Csb2
VAVIPLANVGWEHATGDLLGLAVILPRTMENAERKVVLGALAKFAQTELGVEAHAHLHFGQAGVWTLEHVASPVRSSLKPARWCTTASTWASVTPILLDRFPDHGDPVQEARLIASACRNIGLPEPISIELYKHSAIGGAPSAYFARGQRSLPDWSFPREVKFADRPRRHVILRFVTNIEGPVILGAGRFYGFGLCLPLRQEERGS